MIDMTNGRFWGDRKILANLARPGFGKASLPLPKYMLKLGNSIQLDEPSKETFYRVFFFEWHGEIGFYQG